jgi:exopolyphosphatase/guanosine-5'-triphosphate,3'-diphosphate pyrophosphatase
MICASIDIGTNTLLLLVAEVDNGKIVKVIADKHQIARLGEGLNQSGIISEKATERALKILEEYKNIIKDNNVELVRASATSAMRDAKNSAEVKRLFSEVLGYEIEIINGEEEARISYLGSTENQLNKTEIVLDIGGGSTEVIVGVNGKIEYSKSLQIGAVRTTEQFFPTFEAKTQNYAIARNYIKERLSELNEVNFDGDIIAVAGTPTTIAAIDLNLPQYNAHLIHNHRIELARLDQIIELFKTYTSMELVEKYNVHPNRADVILGGALILKEFTDYAKKDGFVVSCKGLRYGLILDLFKK